MKSGNQNMTMNDIIKIMSSMISGACMVSCKHLGCTAFRPIVWQPTINIFYCYHTEIDKLSLSLEKKVYEANFSEGINSTKARGDISKTKGGTSAGNNAE